MIENTENHIAYTCKCGGVNFAMLKSGGIECNKCSTTLDGVKWWSGGIGAQIARAIKAEDALLALQVTQQAVPAWLPIESAPKFKEVLVWRDDSGPFYEWRPIYTAPQAVPAVCEWKQDADFEMGDTYHSSCGELWSFIDGGPTDNRVSYCNHCGKKVQLAAAPKGAV